MKELNKTMPKVEEKLEKDITEHTDKIMKELVDDQKKMHEWMGKLEFPSLSERQ